MVVYEYIKGGELMFEKVLIIVNPGSGKNLATAYGKKLAKNLSETKNSKIDIRETTGPNDAYKFASTAKDEGFTAVFCLGGDGTVNETIAGLLENSNVPVFGFLPLGTVNDLGRAVGYDLDPDVTINQLLDGQLDQLDVARVNDQVMVNVLALGDLAQSVMETSSEDKNKFGFFAYVKDAIGAALNPEAMNLRIETGQDVYEISTSLLLITLTNSVGGFEKLLPHSSYNDGKMQLTAIKGAHPIDMLKAILEGGITDQTSEQLFVLQSDVLKISLVNNQGQKIIANIDGDPGPSLPLTIEIKKGAIPIIVPTKQ